MHFIRIALISIAISATALPLANAAQIDSFRSGSWGGGAYTNDQTGSFSHCAIEASYNSGITLIFALDSTFQWRLGFYNPNWRLTPGARYPVHFRIDRGSLHQGTAVAISGQAVKMELSPTTRLFQRFRHGYVLRVAAAGKSLNFNLTGTSVALNHLLSCTEHHVLQAKAADSANPFVSVPMTSQKTHTKALINEATVLTANLLARSGISGFSILPEGNVPASLSYADVVWVAHGVVGTANVLPGLPNMKPSKIASSIAGGAASACEGQFASGPLPTTTPLGTMTFGACKTSNGTVIAYYFVLPRSAGGYYVLATVSVGQNTTPAKSAVIHLQQAAYQTMGKQRKGPNK